MSETDVVIDSAKVKYSGEFDMSLLYKNLQDWIKRAKFGSVREVKYVERVKPFGKIIDIVWETSKKALDGYLKQELSVEILIVGLSDVEIMRDGKKLKVNKADLDITFSSSLVRNASERWGDKSFMKRIYETHIISDLIEAHKIELYQDTEQVISETKGFLALYAL